MSDDAFVFHNAFILHTRPYRNTSLLVDCFSEDLGRLTLIAQGARRRTGQFAGLMQPFIPLSLQWRGKHDLKTLTQADVRAPAFIYQGQALVCGLYVNELMCRVLKPFDADRKLFVHYESTLRSLNDPKQVLPALRQFELELLTAAGYAIDFFKTIASQPILEHEYYEYLIGEGFRTVSGGARNPHAFSGEILLAMGQGLWHNPSVCKAAKRLCRQALQPLLGTKPILSRELI
jgi:DNA repair protein RecO (recombination protein O)